MVREAGSAAIFIGTSLALILGSNFKCLDGSWALCPPEPPKLCVKFTTMQQIDCIEKENRPDADSERMRYDFFKSQWDLYSTRK